MGGGNQAGLQSKLPILRDALQYFKGKGQHTVDSWLFRLHHQVRAETCCLSLWFHNTFSLQISPLIIVIGFMAVTFENYLDKGAIVCHTEKFQQYAR